MEAVAVGKAVEEAMVRALAKLAGAASGEEVPPRRKRVESSHGQTLLYRRCAPRVGETGDPSLLPSKPE